MKLKRLLLLMMTDIQIVPDDFDIKKLIHCALGKIGAENKRARTMDIDDFMRYEETCVVFFMHCTLILLYIDSRSYVVKITIK